MGNIGSSKRRDRSSSHAQQKHDPHPLDPFCQPTGLYDGRKSTWAGHEDAVRMLITSGRLAPRVVGVDADDDEHAVSEECSICMFNYQKDFAINHTSCCSSPICTECFLFSQTPANDLTCPYCQSANFGVKYQRPLSTVVHAHHLQHSTKAGSTYAAQLSGAGMLPSTISPGASTVPSLTTPQRRTDTKVVDHRTPPGSGGRTQSWTPSLLASREDRERLQERIVEQDLQVAYERAKMEAEAARGRRSSNSGGGAHSAAGRSSTASGAASSTPSAVDAMDALRQLEMLAVMFGDTELQAYVRQARLNAQTGRASAGGQGSGAARGSGSAPSIASVAAGAGGGAGSDGGSELGSGSQAAGIARATASSAASRDEAELSMLEDLMLRQAMEESLGTRDHGSGSEGGNGGGSSAASSAAGGGGGAAAADAAQSSTPSRPVPVHLSMQHDGQDSADQDHGSNAAAQSTSRRSSAASNSHDAAELAAAIALSMDGGRK